MVFINISGGSNSKKHILSPLNHRLSLFLICLYGGAYSSNEVIKSFHTDIGKDGKKMNDFSTKRFQNYIIDVTKSDEDIKNKISADSPLREQELKNKEINNDVSEEDLNESKTSGENLTSNLQSQPQVLRHYCGGPACPEKVVSTPTRPSPPTPSG